MNNQGITNKGKVKVVKRVEYGRTAYGTHYAKGDFVKTAVAFVVEVVGEAAFEISREAILSLFSGKTRVSGKMLDSMRGMDASKLPRTTN